MNSAIATRMMYGLSTTAGVSKASDSLSGDSTQALTQWRISSPIAPARIGVFPDPVQFGLCTRGRIQCR